MDPTFVIVIVAFFAIDAVVVAVVMMGRRKVAQFEQDCRDRGWTVERQGPGFYQRISGSTGGISWVYLYEQRNYNSATSSSSGSGMRLGRISTESASLPGEVVLVLPHLARSGQVGVIFQSLDKLGGIGRTVLQLFVTRVLEGDDSDVATFSRIQDVQAGSDGFRQVYSVLATSQDAADKVLRRGESALMAAAGDPLMADWNKHMVCLFWRKGIVLPAEKQIDSAARLEALATLLSGLADSLKGW